MLREERKSDLYNILNIPEEGRKVEDKTRKKQQGKQIENSNK